MSTLSSNQNCESINLITHEFLEQQKTTRREVERIAEAHHAKSTQHYAKDRVLPSSGDHQEALTKKNINEEQPHLPVSENAFAGLVADDNDSDGTTLGLIAILGEIMALQAKSNSNFWSTMWKQASQSMLMEVKFAPIIGQAIQSAGMAQSEATKAQADQAKASGMISLGAFGMGVVMGGIQEFKDPEVEDPDPTAAKNITSAAEEGGADTDAIANEATDVDKTMQETTWGSRAQRGIKKTGDVVSKITRRLGSLVDKMSKTSQFIQLGSSGINGLFVESHYQTKKAEQEAIEGQEQALSKESEQYSQFYGQSFTRSEDLRNGAQQNIDYSMNILKSAADTITQMTTSMFRG